MQLVTPNPKKVDPKQLLSQKLNLPQLYLNLYPLAQNRILNNKSLHHNTFRLIIFQNRIITKFQSLIQILNPLILIHKINKELLLTYWIVFKAAFINRVPLQARLRSFFLALRIYQLWMISSIWQLKKFKSGKLVLRRIYIKWAKSMNN